MSRHVFVRFLPLIPLLIAAWSPTPALAQNVDATMQLAAELEAAREYDKAIEQVVRLTQIAPENAEAWFWLSRLYRENGDFARAIETGERGVMLDPGRGSTAIWNNAYTYGKWSEALEARGDYYAAIERQQRGQALLERLVGVPAAELSGNSVRDAQKMGAARLERLEVELKQDDLRAAREAVARGTRYADQRRMTLAEREFLNALELDPNDSVAWKELGRCRAMQGNFESAVDAFTRAIEIDPKFKVAWNNLGAAQNELKTYDEAIKSFDKAIELDSKYAVAINNKALASQMKGDYATALECYNQVLKIDPENAEAHYNIAGIGVLQKDYEGALAHCRRVLAIKPFNPSAWSLAGDICMILKRNDEAIDAYRKALIINPADKDVQASLQRATEARDAELLSKYFNRATMPAPAEGADPVKVPAAVEPPAEPAAEQTPPEPVATPTLSPTGRTRVRFDSGREPEAAMPDVEVMPPTTDPPVTVPEDAQPQADPAPQQ